MACGTEESKIELENSGNVITIDAYLQSQGMRRVSVPADGHCIVHSWRLGLAATNIDISSTELLRRSVDEISNNLSFFKDFLPNEDLLSQLQAYVHLHQYESTVVDLMVYGLANATLTTCVIFSEFRGVVNQTVIEP